jgi:hypothetical protein
MFTLVSVQSIFHHSLQVRIFRKIRGSHFGFQEKFWHGNLVTHRFLARYMEYSYLYSMKATLEIPDELYRNIKARSALEGRPVRAVAIELFEKWLTGEIESGAKSSKPVEHPDDTVKAYPWLKIAAKYPNPEASYDMEDIRQSITIGRADNSTSRRK